ncbi:MAG: hypothetical protein ACE5G1_02845, partial [bacterium]
FDFVRLGGVVFALAYVIFHAWRIGKKRVEIAELRTLPDAEIFKKMYRGSVVLAYFVRGVRSARELRLP